MFCKIHKSKTLVNGQIVGQVWHLILFDENVGWSDCWSEYRINA